MSTRAISLPLVLSIMGLTAGWAQTPFPAKAVALLDTSPRNPLEDSLCPTCEPIPEPALADLTVPESSEGAVGGLAGLTSTCDFPVDAAVVSADTSDQKSHSVAERVALKLLHGTVWATAFGVAAGAGGAALFIDDDHGFGVAVGAISGLFLGSVAGSAFGVNKVDPQDRFIVPLAGSLGGIVAGILAVPPKTSGPELWSLFWPLVASPVAGATLASELWRKPATSSKPHPSGVSIGLKLEPKGWVSGFPKLRF